MYNLCHFGGLLLRSNKIKSSSKRLAILTLLATMLTGCFSLLEDQSSISEMPSHINQISEPKQIISNSLPLREIWRWSGDIMGQGEPSKVLIKDELVILSPTQGRDEMITVLEAQTGNLIWESEPTFERPQSLTVDNERIYAGYTKYVEAYDLRKGTKIWRGSQQSLNKRGGLYVYSKQERIEVYDASSDWPHDERMFTLNPKTGTTVNIIEWPRIFFHKDDIIYSRVGPTENGFDLVAQDKLTKETLWHYAVSTYPRRWPIVVDSVMYLDAGNIYALDADTGELYWQSRAIFVVDTETGEIDSSNLPGNGGVPKIAYSKGLIYAIRSDAAIVGLDAKTGLEVGIVEISPTPVYFDDEGLFQDTYYLIAASDKYVAVYYNDSRELIVFERKDVDP